MVSILYHNSIIFDMLLCLIVVLFAYESPLLNIDLLLLKLLIISLSSNLREDSYQKEITITQHNCVSTMCKYLYLAQKKKDEVSLYKELFFQKSACFTHSSNIVYFLPGTIYQDSFLSEKRSYSHKT